MIDDCFSHGGNRLMHADALNLLKSRLSSIATKSTISLEHASGKILAQDIVAPRNIPAFNNSAVDGYAFAHDDHQPTGGFFPLSARIAAGDNLPVNIEPKSAARIFTGAVMPSACDSIAMQEDCQTHRQDGKNFIIIPQDLKKVRIFDWPVKMSSKARPS